MLLFEACFLFFLAAVFATELAPVIKTKLGPVQGIIESYEDGVEVDKYLGIPYATVSPHNLFGDSLPVQPWSKVFHANRDSIFCPQNDVITGSIYGEIDCLIINVYVPKSLNNTAKLPVMVWTHGGAFSGGTSSESRYGSVEKIVRYGVILVTHNYRVGPYGFMCTGTEDVPGNSGLKDIFHAYEWVRDNIEAFGGDSKNVNAFGQSAGAFSLELFYISPFSKGLFHKLILQSGSMLIEQLEVNYEDKQEETLKVASMLGYSGKDFNGVISFLSSIDPHKVIEASTSLKIRYWACVGKSFEGRLNIVSKQPYESYAKNNFPKIPMIHGVTDKEGMAFIGPNTVITNLGELYSFKFNDDSEKNNIVKTVKSFYFGDNDYLLDGDIDYTSDCIFVRNQDRAVSLFLKKSNEPIYQYVFSYDGGRNYGKYINNLTMPGATHSDEITYLFNSKLFGDIKENDKIIMDRMTTMWTNFAKFGNPTPEVTDLLPIKWSPAQLDKRFYLNIDLELSSGLRAFPQRMAFWDLMDNAYGNITITLQTDAEVQDSVLKYHGFLP